MIAAPARRNRMRQVLGTLLFNVLLPLVVYKSLRPRGEMTALVVTALLPAAKVTVGWLRTRRLDLLGCLVLWEIVLSIGLACTLHNPRLILLKGPVQAGALGLACLLSLLSRSSLGLLLLRLLGGHLGPGEAARWGQGGAEQAAAWRVVTGAWGWGCLLDAVLRAWLVFRLPTALYLVVSPVLQAAFFGGLGAWSLAYLQQRARRPPPEPEAVRQGETQFPPARG